MRGLCGAVKHSRNGNELVTVSDRAPALADAFLERFRTLEGLLRCLTDKQWALPCSGEGWPVGYVAHHIGQGIVRPRGWIEQVLVGEEPFAFDWEVTHELNRRRSAQLGLPPRDDTLRAYSRSPRSTSALWSARSRTSNSTGSALPRGPRVATLPGS